MGNTSSDPVDHVRTTRKHAGEAMKDGVNAPGLISMALGVVAIVLSLAAFATGHATPGIVAAIVAVVLLTAGGLWVQITHRRIRRREEEWLAAHPEADAQPPAS